MKIRYQKVVIAKNDRSETFVTSIILPTHLDELAAKALTRRVNMALAEMEASGVIKQSCYATLISED